MNRRIVGSAALIAALWTCFPALAHARRGFPLFLIISDNPILMVVGAGMLGLWAYFRFSGDNEV